MLWLSQSRVPGVDTDRLLGGTTRACARVALLAVGVGGAAPGVVDDLGDALGRDVLVEGFVHEHRRRGSAGAEALDLDEGELLVVGGLADVDAELGFARLGNLALAAELA